MVALPPHGQCAATAQAIDAAWEAIEAKNERRGYIGASSLGKPCERAIWYEFRWAHPQERFDGRMLRLFNTGHEAEDRVIKWLRMAGVEVSDFDPSTSMQQWGFTDLDGHFCGHADGILTGVLEAPKTRHLFECKSHNLKSFDQLAKCGVAVSKPEHVDQMQIYMGYLGVSRGFYFAWCKNDDRIYTERIKFDVAHFSTLKAKAERVKRSDVIPLRISDNPDYYLCKSFNCPAYAICHGDKLPDRTCRTCIHSTPSSGGEWRCEQHNSTLSRDDQINGCGLHLFLPSIVNGEQIDFNEKNKTITYLMPSGAEWVDGSERAAL